MNMKQKYRLFHGICMHLPKQSKQFHSRTATNFHIQFFRTMVIDPFFMHIQFVRFLSFAIIPYNGSLDKIQYLTKET
uniref:Uncharacterized protein n=1 Tax=Anguilla anguilla TaxID=7936 RepID=A0A0E9Q477_ANGAN